MRAFVDRRSFLGLVAGPTATAAPAEGIGQQSGRPAEAVVPAKAKALTMRGGAGLEVVAAMDELRSARRGPTPSRLVQMLGYHSEGDGGGGIFWWDPKGNEPEDGGIVVKVGNVETGRYRRLWDGGPLNILWFGARRDGSEDCADLVRRAQSLGDVYYPRGLYLQSAVDVRPERRYFGDGMGATVIRRSQHNRRNRENRRSIFILGNAPAQYFSPYPGEAPEPFDLVNVTIEEMTLDFNLIDGWLSFNPLIQFRGSKGYSIRNIRIDAIEFIDSACVVHPEALGEDGGDAWCIEGGSFADLNENITIQNCVSRAEGHQFLGATGSGFRRYHVLSNKIYASWANVITLSTYGSEPVLNEDIVIAGNLIMDLRNICFLIGHDPHPTARRGVGRQQWRNVRITDNVIHIGNLRVCGVERRKNTDYPHPLMVYLTDDTFETLSFSNNNIHIDPDYRGGHVTISVTYFGGNNRAVLVTDGAFGQPAPGDQVEVPIAGQLSSLDVNAALIPTITVNQIIAVRDAGYYRVIRVDLERMALTLELLGCAGHIPTGAQAPRGKALDLSKGGYLRGLQISGNLVQGGGIEAFLYGFVDGLTLSGNTGLQVRSHGLVDRALVHGNSEFAFQKVSGCFTGAIIANQLLNVYTSSKGVVNFVDAVDPATNLDEQSLAVIKDNIQLDRYGGPDVVFRSTTTAPNGSTDVRFYGNISNRSKFAALPAGAVGFGNIFAGGPVPGGTAPTWSNALSFRQTLEFGPLAPSSFQERAIAAPGVTLGATVFLSVPATARQPGIVYDAWVGTANSVNIRAFNATDTTSTALRGVYGFVALCY